MSSRDPHVGQRVSALADGALGHDDRDRALAHVAECARCLCDLEAERRLRARTAGMADPVMPSGLAERLLRIAQDDPWATGAAAPAATRTDDLASRRARRAVRSKRRGVPARLPERAGAAGRSGGPAGSSSGSARPGGRQNGRSAAAGRRAATAFTGGVLTVAGVALGTAFAVGGGTTTAAGTPVVPPVTALTSEFAASSGTGPLSDTSAVGLAAGFSTAAFSLTTSVRPAGAGPRMFATATATTSDPSPAGRVTSSTATSGTSTGASSTGGASSAGPSSAGATTSPAPASGPTTAPAQWYRPSSDAPAWSSSALVAVAGR